MDAGLAKGEGFAVDAIIIKADASLQRGVPGDEQVNWSDPALSTRAVREYLEKLDEEALTETLPKRLSLTDPQVRWTAVPGGPGPCRKGAFNPCAYALMFSNGVLPLPFQVEAMTLPPASSTNNS